MSQFRWTWASVIWFLLIAASHAQTSGDPDPLFRSTDTLNVRIVAPISTILSERSDEEDVDGKPVVPVAGLLKITDFALS